MPFYAKPLDRINDRTAEQLQKERSKSFEPLMNKTKKSAELLGFIDPFQAHLSIGKYGHSKVVGVGSGISGVKMFLTAGKVVKT
ncbi:hypothetical protein [Methylobacter tundripaludum]|uniref:hypothetical protein n=1 Tax=Methylobacter tundripaludum TaxID=173365 RepID=UPI0004DEEDB0|nr:hypothetical protein [Methylobacter tundripaludum]